MLRIVLGAVGGFIAWLIVWVGVEKILSAIWPAFGVHQRAFEEAIKNGGSFTAESPMLLTHIVVGSLVSVMAGSLAALIVRTQIFDPGGLGISMGSEPSIITVTFQEDYRMTNVATSIKFASKTDRDEAFATGMTDGMETSYQRLDGVLSAEART